MDDTRLAAQEQFQAAKADMKTYAERLKFETKHFGRISLETRQGLDGAMDALNSAYAAVQADR